MSDPFEERMRAFADLAARAPMPVGAPYHDDCECDKPLRWYHRLLRRLAWLVGSQ